METSPPPLLWMTNAITTVIDRHHRYHTVNDNNRQEPTVIVCCQGQQWRSLLTEAAVNGGHGNGGLCQRQSSLAEAAVEWRDNDAMASVAIASLANGGASHGGHLCQLSSGS
jgi:hypothetical protein